MRSGAFVDARQWDRIRASRDEGSSCSRCSQGTSSDARTKARASRTSPGRRPGDGSGSSDVAAALNAEALVDAYVIEAENFESIHNHSAYALIERDKTLI